MLARLTALALAGAIVAPWSIRNVVLYGDPFASEAMRHAVAYLITDRSLSRRTSLGAFPRMLTKSVIGVFGWANVLMPTPVYWAYVAASRSPSAARRSRSAPSPRLAARRRPRVAVLVALAVVIRINLQFTQPQGRYLLPGLPAFAVLLALGLRAGAPALARLASPAVVAMALLAGNLYALIGAALPAYHPAPIRTLASGERVMVPSVLGGMAVREGDSHWIVTGAAP